MKYELKRITKVEWYKSPSCTRNAWGAHGSYLGRDTEVLKLLQSYDLWCSGRTKDGHPRHPLRLANATPLELFQEKG